MYDSAGRRQGFVGWWRALAECTAATTTSWVPTPYPLSPGAVTVFLLTIRTRACALAKLAESQEFADRAAKAVPIEQELGLARWLPTAGRQVLASAVVDGQHEPSSPLPSTGALKLKLLAGSGPRTPYPWVLNFSPLYFIFLFSS